MALEKILRAKEQTPSQKRTFEYIELQLAKKILQK